MKIESPAFLDNASIPQKYTCDGEDVNPPLRIIDVPSGAQSLVLIVDDPDAPRGDFVHWTLWNISPDAREISEKSIPEGTQQGITDFGSEGYGGPCPHAGTHRYQFKLYALDTMLDLSQKATKKDIEQAMQNHILGKSMLIGRYART
ncbi:MAG: YbhB/YbcL family Raf kinase inhibitor-like protein [Candidatus Ryanbacteria bacterium]|nr:YbhB/YbcL family Raf kinase inhibitor-like protein [Candidatus Ryanbacteria bacterium]